MKFYLIVAKGKHRGMPIPIEVDLFVIGGAKECQLRAQHPMIGEQHCAVVIRGKKGFVRDLGSGNGTFLNGEEIPSSEEWPLHKGDRLAVGPLEFKITFREQGGLNDLEMWALKTLDEDAGQKVSAVEELRDIQRSPHEFDNAVDSAAQLLKQMSAQKGVIRGRLRLFREGSMTVVLLQDANLVDEAELVHLKKELHDNLNVPNLRVLLDFKNVRKMSASAARMFSDLYNWLLTRGSSLAICRLQPGLRNVVEDLEIRLNIRVFPDKAKAAEEPW